MLRAIVVQLISDSGTRVLQGSTHWERCALDGVMPVGEVVTLEIEKVTAPSPDTSGDFGGGFAGLTFDPHCRLFHAQPETGTVEYVLWGSTSVVGVHDDAPHPFVITAAGTEVEGIPTGALPTRPLALACDSHDYLYVADPAETVVWLIDTWQQEVARRLVFAEPPLDVATDADAVFVLLADGSTWQVAPCETPERTAWGAVAGAERLAVASSSATRGGRDAWVVVRPGQFDAALHSLHANVSIEQPFCTDLAIEASSSSANGGVLVLACRPGEEFRRLQIERSGPHHSLPGLIAPDYDGRGIAIAPDGRVGYWTALGLRHAAPARARYVQSGFVFGFALDSDQDQSTWGNLTVEACVPEGAQIRFWAFTRDDLDYVDAIGGPRPGTGPPVLSQRMWDSNVVEAQTLFRQPSQRPLAGSPADGFALYDAPVMAPPGRFLWLVFRLEGTRGKSPRLRAARVAYPGHRLLAQLPRTLRRETPERDFLFRYLAPIAAMLDEWEGLSDTRHRLLDARLAPAAALSWLAGFVGLVLDACWPVEVQRRMILEAAVLFRTRGTVGSLRRMIEILTGAQVIVIEHFRLRGGGVVGNPDSIASQAVIGVGYRVGGRIGDPSLLEPIEGAEPIDFDEFAHRFTVTVVASLDNGQLTCVRRLIEFHKPAHTDFTLCTATSGLRAGVGAHVGISSVIGKSAGFERALVGDAVLGGGYVLGRPALDPEGPA